MSKSKHQAPSRTSVMENLRAQAHREAVQAGDRAFESPPRGDKRPPRVVAEAERHGVPPTDTEARSPLGVGTSTSARAEKIAQREGEPGHAAGLRTGAGSAG